MKSQWIITAIAAGTISLIGSGNLLAEKKDTADSQGKGRPDRAKMHKKMLEKFDADGDGKLNEEERKKAHAAMQKRSAERFTKADKNGDGKLTEDEVPAEAWKRMSKADKDADGAVSKKELAAAHKARAGKGDPGKSGGKGKHKREHKNPIAQFDKNDDGKLSEDEVPAKVWARMSKADKNADGFVSDKELKQARKNRPGAGVNKKEKKKDGES